MAHLIHWGEIIRAAHDGQISTKTASTLLELCGPQHKPASATERDAMGVNWKVRVSESLPYGSCRQDNS